MNPYGVSSHSHLTAELKAWNQEIRRAIEEYRRHPFEDRRLSPLPTRAKTNPAVKPVRHAKTHCKHGHPFDEVNTFVNGRGHRICRACSREKMARRRAAQKAAA